MSIDFRKEGRESITHRFALWDRRAKGRGKERVFYLVVKGDFLTLSRPLFELGFSVRFQSRHILFLIFTLILKKRELHPFSFRGSVREISRDFFSLIISVGSVSNFPTPISALADVFFLALRTSFLKKEEALEIPFRKNKGSL